MKSPLSQPAMTDHDHRSQKTLRVLHSLKQPEIVVHRDPRDLSHHDLVVRVDDGPGGRLQILCFERHNERREFRRQAAQSAAPC